MRKKKEVFVPYNYVFFQPNPSWKGKGKYRHQDCPIRAICAATEKSWEEVYDLLCETGKEVCDAPTSDQSVERAMSKLGFEKCSVKVTKGSTRPDPCHLTEEKWNKRLVMRVANHLVGGRGGKYYDCWNCGEKGIYTYYQKDM